MGDRATLLEISKILRSLLLLPYGACGEIAPRKGTTRKECYRALWEIQELLQTRKLFFSLPPQTNADRIRSMTDEELANFLCHWDACKTTEGLGYNTENVCGTWICTAPGGGDIRGECQVCALAWLKQEAEE